MRGGLDSEARRSLQVRAQVQVKVHTFVAHLCSRGFELKSGWRERGWVTPAADSIPDIATCRLTGKEFFSYCNFDYKRIARGELYGRNHRAFSSLYDTFWQGRVNGTRRINNSSLEACGAGR